MTTNISWIQETFLRLWYQIIIRVLRRLRCTRDCRILVYKRHRENNEFSAKSSI